MLELLKCEIILNTSILKIYFLAREWEQILSLWYFFLVLSSLKYCTCTVMLKSRRHIYITVTMFNFVIIFTEEMGSFARQWVEPVFQFSPLVFLLVVHLALLTGLITAVPTFSWEVGLAAGGGVFLLATLILFVIWHGSRRWGKLKW